MVGQEGADEGGGRLLGVYIHVSISGYGNTHAGVEQDGTCGCTETSGKV